MRRFIYWGIVTCIWCLILVGGYVGYVVLKMPQASSWAIPERPPNVRILDRNGTLIANRGATGGEAVSLNEMSPWIPLAVIAIEDRRFYSHWGVDPFGIARAIFVNITRGGGMQGGSTITQQLAKNMFLKPERTLERKVQEALLAFWIEHHYSKNQILEMYLNRVYFGSGAYGIEAATRRYFNKSAKDINLLEAATLAGLLKAPSKLSPARNPQAAHARALLVLDAMREENMIKDGDLALASTEPMTKAAQYWTGSENYVADEIIRQLPFLIGEAEQDIIIEATIDMQLQAIAEGAIRKQIATYGKSRDVGQGALISIDGSGAIIAMVGGVDYAESQFNRATEAQRQPGSAFKPFVYLAALEAGRTPNSVRNDAPVKIGKWTPRNYGGKYMGQVTLATALSHSLNSIAAQLIMEVGTDTVISTAHRLGIHSNITDNISIALGTSEVSLMELTSAFIPFANGGMRPQLRLISRITDADGKVLYEFGQVTATQVIEPDIVSMMNAMLKETVLSGTAKSANIGRPAAGKTGTSQNSRDAWFIGYTADYTTGVWFGNDDGHSMKNVTGGTLPVSVWKTYMQAAEKGKAPLPLPTNYQLKNALPGGSDYLPDSNSPSPYPPAPRPASPVYEPVYPPAPAIYPQNRPLPPLQQSPPASRTPTPTLRQQWVPRPPANVGQ